MEEADIGRPVAAGLDRWVEDFSVEDVQAEVHGAILVVAEVLAEEDQVIRGNYVR